MVLWSPERDVFEPRRATAACASGATVIASTSRGAGRNPFADQSTDRFAGLDRRASHPFPAPCRRTAYPFAFEQVAQLFDHPAAPDVCVVHTAAHNWEDQGGHRGEHGSLGVVQARAPFVIAGKGVRADGLRRRARAAWSTSRPRWPLLGCRLRSPAVAVPTAWCSTTCSTRRRAAAEHVVGFLFDGTNANVLYDDGTGG